ncbi:MAG: hypothetical protein A2Y57_00295 [Candidatus Woykebacteria bacterium RBG_13_40_7b]|uniref:SnoaL-like domain-containing protein n=1 Tax=Candidatus Woykebacteria bacterium RBG_13_40_7b TaxID=1802594 RepID=A0A1G1WAM2_9BACT|nr:MAG: hypothetical protein A2Y57_00295 [Candidatus Woykebacteria bacterium RBG_13_40_7b]
MYQKSLAVLIFSLILLTAISCSGSEQPTILQSTEVPTATPTIVLATKTAEPEKTAIFLPKPTPKPKGTGWAGGEESIDELNQRSEFLFNHFFGAIRDGNYQEAIKYTDSGWKDMSNAPTTEDEAREWYEGIKQRFGTLKNFEIPRIQLNWDGYRQQIVIQVFGLYNFEKEEDGEVKTNEIKWVALVTRIKDDDPLLIHTVLQPDQKIGP